MSKEIMLSSKRLEFLVDGVFAIAMTLLVLNLDIPRGSDPGELGKILRDQLNGFVAYIGSFIILGTYWIAHIWHFQHIVRTNIIHIWINILLLCFVALMPFSAALITNYPTTISEIIFGLNVMAMAFLILGNWAYVTKGHRLVEPELEQSYIQMNFRTNIVTPVICILAMAVSFYNPRLSFFMYLLMFPGYLWILFHYLRLLT